MEPDRFVSKLLAFLEDSDEWNASRLSQAAGMDRSVIRNWRESRAKPSLTSAAKICSALGLTYEQFMLEGDDIDETMSLYRQLPPELQAKIREKVLAYHEAIGALSDTGKEDSEAIAGHE